MRVSPAEVERIARFLGLSVEAVRARHLAASGDRLRDGLGHRCVFLVDGPETSCRIHPARPDRCRSWPYWPELLADPEAWREACRLCPGIEPEPEPDAG